MQVRVDFTDKEMLEALNSYLDQITGINLPFKIIIEVKSKQNYKSEWEEANFRGHIIYIGDNK